MRRLPPGEQRITETQYGSAKTSFRPGRKYEPLNKGGEHAFHGVCKNCDRSFVLRDPHHSDVAMAVPPLSGDVIVCENCDAPMLVMGCMGHEVVTAEIQAVIEGAPLNDATKAPPLARCPACGVHTMTKAEDGRWLCARGHRFQR